MGFFATLISGYKIMGQETGAYIKKNRAQLACGVSIIGTIASNIMSTFAGAKSARTIDAKEAELGRPLNKVEKVKLVWKNHVVPAATATGSCIASSYSNNQHVKNFNAAANAYGVLKRAYDSTQKATKEVLGEKKAAELQDKINQKYLEEHPETKKQIISSGPNPDPSTMRKFWEPISGIDFYCTVDKIELALKEMQSEMKLIKPRTGESYIANEDKCVKLIRFFDLLDVDVPQAKRESEIMKYYAFIKGKEANGSDDDLIDAWYTPMILDDNSMETCAAINWATRPSDYRYGNFVKC